MASRRRKILLEKHSAVTAVPSHLVPDSDQHEEVPSPTICMCVHPQSVERKLPVMPHIPYDSRDIKFISVTPPHMVAPSFSMKTKLPYVLDRIDFGAAHAATNVLRYEIRTTDLLSANMMLYIAKTAYCKVSSNEEINTVPTRLLLKAAANYDIAPVDTQVPSRDMFLRGIMSENNLSMVYRSVPRECIREVIWSNHPVIFSIDVYDTFLSNHAGKTGQITLPDTTTEKFVGTHSMVITGYNNVAKKYEVLNSWSSSWGDHGFCYIPYEYFEQRKNLTRDFWMVEMKPAQKPVDPNPA